MNVTEIVIQLFPLVLSSVVGLIVYFVNSKMELIRAEIGNLRVETARAQECRRHLEADIQMQQREFENWRLNSTRLHGELAGADDRIELMVTQVSSALNNLINKFDRTMESVPRIISAAQRELNERVSKLEKNGEGGT